jgi:uncharacterized protein (DUF1330 family)
LKSAYVIGNIIIKDKDKWLEYRARVAQTLRPWGGELVFRGKALEALSGKKDHTDTVVISFPGMDYLNGWFNSDDYQELIPTRNLAAKMDLISYSSEA